MNIEAWATTHIGLVRKSNQDSVGCFPELGLFIVADGMGGHADGEVASSMAVAVIREFFDETRAAAAASGGFLGWLRKLLRPAPTPAATGPGQLDAAVSLANQRIYEVGQANSSKGQERPLGTTVVVLTLAGGRACWAHVGDSRLYRLRGGQLELLTADHTLYGEPYLANPPIPLDVPHTNRLTQAVGIRQDVAIASESDSVRPGDLFLLCSDGVSGFLEPAALHEKLTTQPTLEAAGQSLIQSSLDAGGRDNASVVLVKVEGESLEDTIRTR